MVKKNNSTIIIVSLLVLVLLLQPQEQQKESKKMVGEVTRSFSSTVIPEGGGEITITYDGTGAPGETFSVEEPVPTGWTKVSGPGVVTEGVYRLFSGGIEEIVWYGSQEGTWNGQYGFPGSGGWLDFPPQTITVGEPLELIVTRTFSDLTLPEGGGELTITYTPEPADQYSIIEPVPAGWSHVSGPGVVTEGEYRLVASSEKVITWEATLTGTWYGQYSYPGSDWINFVEQEVIVEGGDPPVNETCAELGGTICSPGQLCSGGSMQQSSDTDYCCVGGTCTDQSGEQTCEEQLGCEIWEVCNEGQTGCEIASWVYVIGAFMGFMFFWSMIKK